MFGDERWQSPTMFLLPASYLKDVIIVLLHKVSYFSNINLVKFLLENSIPELSPLN